MTNRWIPYPDDRNDPRYRWPLEHGDSWLVRTNEGAEVTAVYDASEEPVFYLCDDWGNATSDEPLTVVSIAMSENSILGPRRFRFPVVQEATA